MRIIFLRNDFLSNTSSIYITIFFQLIFSSITFTSCKTKTYMRAATYTRWMEFYFFLFLCVSCCNGFILRTYKRSMEKWWKRHWQNTMRNKIRERDKIHTYTNSLRRSPNEKRRNSHEPTTIKFKLQMSLVHLSYTLTTNMSDGFHKYISLFLFFCLFYDFIAISV